MSSSHYSRNYLAGVRAFLIWLSNPVSDYGAAQTFRMLGEWGGPEMDRIRRRMRRDPEGSRVLRDRPDLCATLSDMAALGRMPEGSVGRVYHDFMSGPDVIAGYMVSGLVFRDGYYDHLPWDEELKWLLWRLGNTHDLTHVLSGYGADLAAEALNINFSIGLMDPESPVLRTFTRVFGVGSAAVLDPSCGRRDWIRHMQQAYERGAAAGRHRPFQLVYYEQLLPRPLEQVRRELGIAPLPPEVADTSRWLHNRASRGIAGGYGVMARAVKLAKRGQRLVEAGVPVRDLMSADRASQALARNLFDSGAPLDQVVAVLRKNRALA